MDKGPERGFGPGESTEEPSSLDQEKDEKLPNPEEKDLKDNTGNVFENVADLNNELHSKDSRFLRFHGMKLTKDPSKGYFKLEKDLNASFDAVVFQVKYPDGPNATRISLNVYNYKELDDLKRPKLIYDFALNKDNIQDYRIEIIPTEIFQRKIKEEMGG